MSSFATIRGMMGRWTVQSHAAAASALVERSIIAHADELCLACCTLSGPGMSTPSKSMDPMSVVSLLVALPMPPPFVPAEAARLLYSSSIERLKLAVSAFASTQIGWCQQVCAACSSHAFAGFLLGGQGAGHTLPAGLQLGEVLVLQRLLGGAPARGVEAEHAGQQVDGDLARRAQPPEQRRRPALQPLHRACNPMSACFSGPPCSTSVTALYSVRACTACLTSMACR